MMFLYQSKGYNYRHLTYQEFKDNMDKIINKLVELKPDFMCFDTETTGLSIIKDVPFLVSIGFGKNVFTFDYDKELVSTFFNKLLECGIQDFENYIGLFAHNCKYDYHMMENGGSKIPEGIKLYDSITIGRLTEYATDRESMSLTHLGGKYVDKTAKFAGDVINKHIIQIRKERKVKLKEVVTEKFGKTKFKEVFEAYDKHVQFLDDDNEYYNFVKENYKEPNYKDSYDLEPDLMRSYAADDVVIMIEYINQALPKLKQIDKGLTVFNREAKLIRVIAELEKQGFKIDIDYVVGCRKRLLNYRQQLYAELLIYTGVDFTVGQHKLIMKILKDKYDVNMINCDVKALKLIKNCGKYPEIVVDIVSNIIELRTLDKWLTTYIDGKLNMIIDGRLHTNINNNGAVSGRVSCDLQQQPKDALLDRNGEEIFHPRKMFICDDDHIMVFIDESQMELRIQAYYTMLIGEPDLNLCRAYIPYKCHNDFGVDFDYNNDEHLRDFDQCEWFKDESNEKWTPTDLHSETTHHAFPDIPMESDEFKKKRKLGKVCNFLKVYQGGVQALQDSLDLDRETAESLDNAFYKAFPQIKDYQDWVNKNLELYGFVENLYGRKYYMNNSREFYKGCNYLIQGTCADMVKTFEINLAKYLKENNLKTKMILPVHDEIIFKVPKGEEHIVKDLQAIMQDTYDIVKTMPMIAEIEWSETNWRNKKDWSEYNAS